MSEFKYSQDYTLLVRLVKESYATEVIRAAQEKGAHGATIVLGKGTLTKAQASFFGAPLEIGRQIIFLAVRKDRKKEITQHIYNCSGLKTKAHGLVFEIPLFGAAGIAPVNLFDKNASQTGGRL